MSYATIDDVKAYFPGIESFDSSGAITDTQVTNWLSEDAAYIDNRISKITALSDITISGTLILRQINAMITADKVDKALPYFNTRKEEEKKKLRDLKKEALDILILIESGILRISDSIMGSIQSLLDQDAPLPTYYSKTDTF